MSTQKKIAILLPAAILIAAGFIIYSNSICGKFVFDDEVLVKDNVYIKSRANLTHVFTGNLIEGAARKSVFYRPVQAITYMADYSVWKLDVRGYHITNIILHVLAALSVYWITLILSGARAASFFTALLFITHPVHTEAVAYISGRADILSALFMMLCLAFYIKQCSVKRIGIYSAMMACFVLAVLSKEYALILPVLILIYHYAFRRKVLVSGFLSILSISLVYIIIRVTILNFVPAHPLHPAGLFQRVPGFFAALFNYFKLLILPVGLHMEYGNGLFRYNDPRVVLGFIIFCLSMVYAFRKRRDDSIACFSILWFYAALLPLSNLYPVNAYMAEHWLYVPSVGFFIILGKILGSAYAVKKIRIFALCAVAALCLFYSYLTVKQNETWRDPVIFYERTLKYAPRSPRIYNQLGLEYKKLRNYKEAERLFNKAIETDADYAEAYYNLGNLYLDTGRVREAGILFAKIIKIDPDNEFAYDGLGSIYVDAGRNEEGVAMYKKAIDSNPKFINAYVNLADAYSRTGRNEEAINICMKAISINPDFAYSYNNLGNAYRNLRLENEAMKAYERAVYADPKLAAAHVNLAIGYYYTTRYDSAVKHCDEALALGYKIDPDFLEKLKPYRK